VIRKQNLLAYILIAAAALLGMALAAYATTSGPGVGGDATIYLTSARNFLSGQGLGWTEADGSFRLLPYTPPFYPLVLSAVGLLSGDLVSGARWLNLLLFGGLSFMLGWYFAKRTGNHWLAAALAGLIAASPVIVGVQVWAMSEPLFLLLGFASLLLLLEHLSRPHPLLLVGAALLVGLAFLTRFIGLAFVTAGGLALLGMGRQAEPLIHLPARALRLPRLREALWFGGIAVLPTLVWMLISLLLTGTFASRSGQPVEAYCQRFLEIGPALQKIVLFWLLPDSVINRLPGPVQMALWVIPLIALIGFGLWLARRRPAGYPGYTGQQQITASARLALLLGLFIGVYLIVLAGVQVFTYPPVTLASRMLAPVHLAVLVLLLALLHLGLAAFTARSRLAHAVVYLAALALFGAYLLRSALIVRDYHQAGIGYNARVWVDSQVIQALDAIPADVPLISNEVTAIMYLAGRPAYALQEIYQDQPQEPFTVYGTGADVSQQVFREQNGALVLFAENLPEDFSMYGDRVDERLEALTGGLFLYFESKDGAIYFANRPAFSPPNP